MLWPVLSLLLTSLNVIDYPLYNVDDDPCCYKDD